MAPNSKLLVIVLLVLFSLSVTFGYSLSPRDAVSKKEDETHVMAVNDQGSSIINVDDLPKARSLQALVDGSKVSVNKATSIKSKKDKKKKKEKKKKNKKNGGLEAGALVGIIIAAIVVTIIILCILYYLYDRHKTKKAQSFEHTEKDKETSETKTSKADDHV